MIRNTRFVIDAVSLSMQFRGDPPVPVPSMVREHHLLDRVPGRHFRFVRGHGLPVPVITGPADDRQLAHPLDA
jgi:hypothetical protein